MPVWIRVLSAALLAIFTGVGAASAAEAWWSAPLVRHFDYDARCAWSGVDGRYYVYGGQTYGRSTNDLLWALDPSHDGPWKQVPEIGERPGARMGAELVYEARRARLLYYGGYSEAERTQKRDLWEKPVLGNRPWHRLDDGSTGPDAFGYQPMLIDPIRDRLLVLSGRTGATDIWSYDLRGIGGWSRLIATGTPPGPTVAAHFAYDPIADRIVLFGAGPSSGGLATAVHVLALTPAPQWISVTASGEPPPNGIASVGSLGLVYDEQADVMRITNGARIWHLNLRPALGWQEVAPKSSSPVPEARVVTMVARDPTGHRDLMFGGLPAGGRANDFWVLSGAESLEWHRIVPAGGGLEHSMDYHTLVCDEQTGRLYQFGGQWIDSEGDRDSVYVRGPELQDRWVGYPGYGIPQLLHSAAVDPVRRRMLVVAGPMTPGIGGPPAPSDVWSMGLNDMHWTHVDADGADSPPAWSTRACFDVAGDRLLAFSPDSGVVWALNFSPTPAWSRISAAGAAPRNRWGPMLAFDAVHRRWFLYGGFDFADRLEKGDLHVLELTGEPRWVPLPLTSVVPAARYFGQLAYDPAEDRLLMYGGIEDSFEQHDAWELRLGGALAWNPVSLQGAGMGDRGTLASAFDPVRSRFAIMGGDRREGDGLDPVGDLHFLNFSGTLDVPTAAPRRQALEFSVRPNPARGPLEVRLSSPAASGTRVEIWDVAGRSVARARLREGARAWTWAAGGARGMYFVRVSDRSNAATRRVVLLD